ncbi:MAG: tetratricopeptide repeat protein [Promethearchaeota archaeon]
MSLTILGIILDTILSLVIVLYLIWDHLKDDRLLTKRVQEFYSDIENLIYYYYCNEIAKEFLKIYRGKIEIPLKLQELNESSNKHYFYKIKVKKAFKRNSKYLGLISLKEEKEKEEQEKKGEKEEEKKGKSDYINETFMILNEEGVLTKRLGSKIIKDCSDIKPEEIDEINKYLESLRTYWTSKHHKFFTPKLEEKVDFKKDLMNYIQNLEKKFKAKSKEDLLLKGNLSYFSKNYDEAIEFFNRALEIDSQFKEAWLNKGITLANQEKYGEAMKCYKEALKIDPEFREVELAVNYIIRKVKKN